jgi:probable rRNA maturation factor
MSVEAIIEDARWLERAPGIETLAERCRRAAAERAPPLSGDVAVLFADDAAVRELNRRYRGKNAPTNVLSFPSGESGFLGDVALAFETCAREAEESRKPFADHAAHLLVHGLLHLAGYDHETDAEAEKMEALEAEVLDALGVSDPYADEDAPQSDER